MYFINGHEVLLDSNENLEARTGYDRVIWLAMDFIKRCPRDNPEADQIRMPGWLNLLMLPITILY